jgi:competence protein ComEC
MFSRPLVPALGATMVGILIGRSFQVDLPVVLLPLAALLVLGISYLLPFRVHPAYLAAVFILLGINSQAARLIPANLRSLADGDAQVRIEGTIYKPPYVRSGKATFPIHAERIFRAGDVDTVTINLLVTVYRYRRDLAVGDRIRMPAEIREFSNFHNPGGFDYRFYMQSRGIALMAVVRDGRSVVPMGEGELGFLDSLLERARGPLRGFFHRRLSSHMQAIYAALILGERQGLTSRIREPFDRTGVGHIMAVSGLHLGLVAWLFFTFSRWTLSRFHRLLLMLDIRKLAALITAVPVLGYGLITGFHLSSQRAVVMILVFLCSIIIGRERDVWSSLCLAALLILVLSADSLFTASFQLSFIAVAGILWLSPIIFSHVWGCLAPVRVFQNPPFLNAVLKYVIGLVAVTTAATVMTIPLIAHHFHRFSFVALPANLTVVPVIGLWVVPLGLLSSAALFISPALAGFLLSLSSAGLGLALSVVQGWSNLPWSSIWVIRPSWIEIILVYGLLYMVIRFPPGWFYKVLMAVLLTALFVDMGYWVYQTRLNRDLRVTVLDVGRNSAALIQFPGKERMLIEHNVFEPWGFHLPRIAIAPYLWRNKITRVDYLVPIEPDLPRSDKLQFMAETFHVREIISGIAQPRSIAGARIGAERAGEVAVSCRGWSFVFSDAGVQVHNERPKAGEECSEFLIITDERKTTSRGMRGIRIAEAGAVTLSIDRNGSIRARGFLQKNLPLCEGGSIGRYPTARAKSRSKATF